MRIVSRNGGDYGNNYCISVYTDRALKHLAKFFTRADFGQNFIEIFYQNIAKGLRYPLSSIFIKLELCDPINPLHTALLTQIL